MSQVQHLTQEGYNKLLEELRKLKEEKLPEILEKLKAAIAQGDLSENAEYEQAMEEKAMVEARIAELEEFLKNVKIIEGSDTDTVGYGNKVTIMRNGAEEVYEIVGSGEVNIFENKISLDSPLGQAIKGRRKGETVKVESPGSTYEVKILDIN